MAADDRKRERIEVEGAVAEPRAAKWLRGLERATEANRARLSMSSSFAAASLPAPIPSIIAAPSSLVAQSPAASLPAEPAEAPSTPTRARAGEEGTSEEMEEEEEEAVESLPESFRKIEGPFPRDWSFAKRLRFLSVRPLRIRGLPAKLEPSNDEPSSFHLHPHPHPHPHPHHPLARRRGCLSTRSWASTCTRAAAARPAATTPETSSCASGPPPSETSPQTCSTAILINNNNTDKQMMTTTSTALAHHPSCCSTHHQHQQRAARVALAVEVGMKVEMRSEGRVEGTQWCSGRRRSRSGRHSRTRGIEYKMRLADGSVEAACAVRGVEVAVASEVVEDLRALRSVPGGQAVALESHKTVASTAASRSKFISIDDAEHIDRFLLLFLAEHARTMADRQASTPLPRILAPRPFLNCVLRGLTSDQSVLVRPGHKKTQHTQLLVVEPMAHAPLLPSVVDAIVRMIAHHNPTELIEAHVVYSAPSEKKDLSSLLRLRPLLHFAIDSGSLWAEPM